MATGYSLSSPSPPAANIGAASASFSVTSVGGAFVSGNAITVQSSNIADQISYASGSATVIGNGTANVTFQPATNGTFFTFTLTPAPGFRVLTFTNNASWSNPNPVPFWGIDLNQVYGIADAIAAAVSALSGTIAGVPSFMPARLYSPVEDLPTLATTQIQVFVLSNSDDVNLVDRDSDRSQYVEDVSIDVGILVKLSAGIDPTTIAGLAAANAFIDPCIKLARTIATMFSPGQNLGGAGLKDAKWPLLYDASKLRTESTLLSVIKFTLINPSSSA